MTPRSTLYRTISAALIVGGITAGTFLTGIGAAHADSVGPSIRCPSGTTYVPGSAQAIDLGNHRTGWTWACSTSDGSFTATPSSAD
jgi:hypothetical protein